MKLSIINKGTEFIKTKTLDFSGNITDIEFTSLPLGSICDDLYNLDFNSFDDFEYFITKYGLYSVNNLCNASLDKMTFKSDVQAIRYLYDDTDCISALKKLQDNFKPYIENVFISDALVGTTNDELLTAYLQSTGSISTINQYARDFNISHEQPRSDKDFYVETYEHRDISGIAFVEFKEMLKINTHMKQCRNCSRYFTVSGRSDTEYCSVPNKNGTSCRVAAYNKSAHQKLKDDEIGTAYKRASMLKYHWHKKGVVAKSELESWRRQAKQHMKEVRAGHMNPDDFITWLKQ